MAGITDVSTLDKLGLTNRPELEKKNLGQEDFLKLMMTQLNNQDPMKPMENGEFLGQMAQFGTVNGIEGLNKNFTKVADALYSNQALQASSLVGRNIEMPSNHGYLPAGGAMQGSVDLPASGNVAVNIHDTNGQLIKRIDLGVHGQGKIPFTWDGKATDGTVLPAGKYVVSAETSSGGKSLGLESFITAKVESVTLGGGGNGLTLNLAGLGDVDFAKVSKVM